EFGPAISRGKAAGVRVPVYAGPCTGNRSGARAAAAVPIRARSAQATKDPGARNNCPFIAAHEFWESRNCGRASSLGLPTSDRQCRSDEGPGAGDVEESSAPAGRANTRYGTY